MSGVTDRAPMCGTCSVPGTWAITAHISIFDVECLNAFLRRQHLIGRAPDFSTTASKLHMKEHTWAFEKTHGIQVPDIGCKSADAINNILTSTRQTVKAGPKGPSGYNSFVKAEMQCRDIQCNYAGFGGGDDFGGSSARVTEVNRRWACLPPCEKEYWKTVGCASADQHDKHVENQEKSRVAVDSLWAPTPLQLMGNRELLMKQDEYESALDHHQTTRNMEKQWMAVHNKPVGVEEALGRAVIACVLVPFVPWRNPCERKTISGALAR